MDYEKEYKKRLDDARYWHDVSEGDIPLVLEEIFSELRESEDEKIRKVIIGLLKQSTYEDCVYDGVNMKDIYAWLEKQGKETSWKPSKEDDVRRRSTIQTLEYARSLDIYNQYGKADIDKNIAWLEKQGEQKLPIEKLPEEMKTIGESLGFTTQEECDGYNQMVSDLIMSDDKAEPKFHEGDWIVTSYGKVNQVVAVDKDGDGFTLDDDTYFSGSWKDGYHLWTIQDAKDGDVLREDSCTFIIERMKPNGTAIVHCCLFDDGDFDLSSTLGFDVDSTHPATKEQRDLLFQKMQEAGYTFDFEKKDVMKIDDEEYNGEDYGIDSLYHAQRILEKTLGEVNGYQSDDGILEHKCAISAVKKLYEHKPTECIKFNNEFENQISHLIVSVLNGEYEYNEGFVKYVAQSLLSYAKNELRSTGWSEEDENMVRYIGNAITCKESAKYLEEKGIDIIKAHRWLESFNPQPKQEWSEEDEEMIEGLNNCLDELEKENGWRYIYVNSKNVELNKVRNWVKSLKQRIGG